MEIDGYEGSLNNKSYFWVTGGSRIFPPCAHLWLNISQDLYLDFGLRIADSRCYRPVIEYFATAKKTDDLGERILTALAWHNRSIEIDIDESVALANLAIAFESLLGLRQGDELTERFKEAVSLLVGDIPRLDSWLTQFYKARSQIVHRGWSDSLMFVATDDPKKTRNSTESEYRSLASYGRQVFQVCVAAVLTGAKIAERLKLASLLVTNEQRLEKICKILRGNGSPAERIRSASQEVFDVETYQFVTEKGLRVEHLIGAMKLMITAYLDSTPNESPELIKRMGEFASVDASDHYNALELLRGVRDSIGSHGMSQSDPPRDLHCIVASLVGSVWHYTLLYYLQLTEMKKQEAEKGQTLLSTKDDQDG
jgi:hypothetical protein